MDELDALEVELDELEEEELLLLLDELEPGEESGSGGPAPPQPDRISIKNGNPRPNRLICMKASNHYYYE